MADSCKNHIHPWEIGARLAADLDKDTIQGDDDLTSQLDELSHTKQELAKANAEIENLLTQIEWWHMEVSRLNLLVRPEDRICVQHEAYPLEEENDKQGSVSYNKRELRL